MVKFLSKQGFSFMQCTKLYYCSVEEETFTAPKQNKTDKHKKTDSNAREK